MLILCNLTQFSYDINHNLQKYEGIKQVKVCFGYLASSEGVMYTGECPRVASVGGGDLNIEGQSRVTSIGEGGLVRVTSGGGFSAWGMCRGRGYGAQ